MTRELARSAAMQRWSFQVKMTLSTNNPLLGGSFVTDNLVSVGIDTSEARAWTLNLNAWKYSDGLLTLPNVAAANQTAARIRLYAQIVYGVNGADETVLVDYPPRGCSMQLGASEIRVSLLTQGVVNETVLPTLGGYIVPFAHDRVAAGPPTFSTAIASMPGLSNQLYPIPARAVAYRAAIPNGPTLQPLSLDQMREDGTTVINRDATLQTLPDEQLAENRAAWYPLFRHSQFVLVTNQDVGAGNTSVFLQFLLDLG